MASFISLLILNKATTHPTRNTLASPTTDKSAAADAFHNMAAKLVLCMFLKNQIVIALESVLYCNNRGSTVTTVFTKDSTCKKNIGIGHISLCAREKPNRYREGEG